MIKIEDLMTRHPHTLTSSETVEQAQKLMHQHEIRHIPIVDELGALVGVLSQRDILRAQNSSLIYSQTTSELFDAPISQLMNGKVISVSPKAGLKQSAIFMQKHKVGCLPVVEQGELVGIITDSDFVAIAINLLELEEESEPVESDFPDMDTEKYNDEL
ncbi:CBS domain-containing protein [Vibrio sp. RC27]